MSTHAKPRATLINESGDPGALEAMRLLSAHSDEVRAALDRWARETGVEARHAAAIFGYSELVANVLRCERFTTEPLACAVMLRHGLIHHLQETGRAHVARGVAWMLAKDQPDMIFALVCSPIGITQCWLGQSGATCAGGAA